MIRIPFYLISLFLIIIQDIEISVHSHYGLALVIVILMGLIGWECLPPSSDEITDEEASDLQHAIDVCLKHSDITTDVAQRLVYLRGRL